MDAFVSRKRKHGEDEPPKLEQTCLAPRNDAAKETDDDEEEESTEVKLATLASLCSCDDTAMLLETLLTAGGSVEAAAELLNCSTTSSRSSVSPRKKMTNAALGVQSSLSSYRIPSPEKSPAKKKSRPLTKKGRTLHLYSADDIAEHTPCSIIHNFLSPAQADALLRELMDEAPTWHQDEFQLFDRTVVSPHTSCFYVDDYRDAERQKSEYVYNGRYIDNVRQTLPEMLRVSLLVKDAVNAEIARRIRTHYPAQKKLPYQSSREWTPNTAVVNCYDGAKQSVGWHADQLTYLGPRAVIGSLSLGVAREFRVRRIVPRAVVNDSSIPIPPPPPLPSLSTRDDDDAAGVAGSSSRTTAAAAEQTKAAAAAADVARADTEGQIAIHLPHNSLLVMHAEMQEEWKHSIAPAQTVEPHPLARNKRINITYRCYRAAFAPALTPRCRCNMPCQLKCVQRQPATRGRYMWMCDVGFVPGRHSCGFFKWAEFDDEGEPPWAWPNQDQDQDQQKDQDQEKEKEKQNLTPIPVPSMDAAPRKKKDGE